MPVPPSNPPVDPPSESEDIASVPDGAPRSQGSDADRARNDIERLRTFRVRRERDLSIDHLVAQTRKESDAVRRRLGSLLTLWQSLVPPELAAATALTGVRGGVLHVTADSSAVAFEIDRRLRAGLTARLRDGYRGTLTRVRVTVGPGPS